MWNTIKKILSKQDNKCIIVEENQPAYIVMRLEDYEKMSDKSQSSDSEVEKVNRNIDEWKAESDKENDEAITDNSEEVKVEDLPF